MINHKQNILSLALLLAAAISLPLSFQRRFACAIFFRSVMQGEPAGYFIQRPVEIIGELFTPLGAHPDYHCIIPRPKSRNAEKRVKPYLVLSL